MQKLNAKFRRYNKALQETGKKIKRAFFETPNATGELEICLRGPDGKIKERNVFKNLVVTTGRQHIANQLLSTPTEATMSHMAIGEGTTAQVVTDTNLESEISRKAFTSKDQGSGSDANKIIYVASWPAGEGTGAITEAGIFNASGAGAGVMLCRTTFGEKNKGAGDSLTLTWTITITG